MSTNTYSRTLTEDEIQDIYAQGKERAERAARIAAWLQTHSAYEAPEGIGSYLSLEAIRYEMDAEGDMTATVVKRAYIFSHEERVIIQAVGAGEADMTYLSFDQIEALFPH